MYLYDIRLLGHFVGNFSSPHDLEQDESNALAILDDYFTGAPCHANSVFKNIACIHYIEIEHHLRQNRQCVLQKLLG